MRDGEGVKHGHPARPEARTTAATHYYEASEELVRFLAFVAKLATRADEVRTTAAKALLEADRDLLSPEDQEKYVKTLAEPELVRKQLGRFAPFLQQIALSRAVDNYLAYVSDLLATVFRTRPETLRSQGTVDLDFVLDHDSMEDLIDALAERRVDRRASRGLRDLTSYLRTTLGFDLFLSEGEAGQVERAVDQRHVIVHNRGTVDQRYARRFGDEDGAVGEPLILEADWVWESIEALSASVRDIDARAAAKWGLKQTEPPTPIRGE